MYQLLTINVFPCKVKDKSAQISFLCSHSEFKPESLHRTGITKS